jgi:hypothetical protein
MGYFAPFKMPRISSLIAAIPKGLARQWSAPALNAAANVVVGAELHRLDGGGYGGIAGKDDNLGRNLEGPELPEHVDAPEAGHGEVEDYRIVFFLSEE